MSILPRAAALLAAIVLCAPAVALAQRTSTAQGGAGVSTQPPVPLGDGAQTGSGASPASPRSPAKAPSAGGLPDTGSDPRLLLLAGAALTLLGVGLRLRTADAELY